MSRTFRQALIVAAAFGLAGCTDLLTALPKSTPRAPAAPAAPAPAVQSAESIELERYYASIQAGLLTQGLLRTDGGGPDTPFSRRDLVENFIRIALFEEYTDLGGRLVQRQTASSLNRWAGPIRVQVEFGATVDPAKQETDRAAIARYTRRLSAATGLPMRMVADRANFNIFIVNEDERRALGPRLRSLIEGLSDAAIETVTDLPRSSYCLVFALDPDDDGTYSRAVAIIRAEHPDLLRLSCIHEEVAQGLGLSNDSPDARPSVFNDDEEFGLLTTQDELMLSILYDPRLRPGMTADEARPIVEAIATELLGGSS